MAEERKRSPYARPRIRSAKQMRKSERGTIPTTRTRNEKRRFGIAFERSPERRGEARVDGGHCALGEEKDDRVEGERRAVPARISLAAQRLHEKHVHSEVEHREREENRERSDRAAEAECARERRTSRPGRSRLAHQDETCAERQ